MGAPIGARNRSAQKPWEDVVKRAVLAGDGKKLRAMADKVIDMAIEGDIQAIKEIAQRLDGMPRQQVAIEGELGLNMKLADILVSLASPK